MRVLVPAIALVLVSCASHLSLTKFEPFKDQVGVELRTERVTYIYDFPHSPQSLWDHTFKYKYGGEIHMREEEPKALCPAGSIVRLEEVRQTRQFDNPIVIEALGKIDCGGSVLEFRYVWGLGSEIHAAPWESESYDPREKRRVL